MQAVINSASLRKFWFVVTLIIHCFGCSQTISSWTPRNWPDTEALAHDFFLQILLRGCDVGSHGSSSDRTPSSTWQWRYLPWLQLLVDSLRHPGHMFQKIRYKGYKNQTRQPPQSSSGVAILLDSCACWWLVGQGQGAALLRLWLKNKWLASTTT